MKRMYVLENTNICYELISNADYVTMIWRI